MFLTEEKLKARIAELEPLRYTKRQAISGWKVKEDVSKEDKYPPAVDATWRDFPVGERFEGRDYYLWIDTDFTVPKIDDDNDLVLLFYFGKTGGGHNSGFESLLFINEKPYQGVDSNHGEVFLGKEYSGQTIRLSIKLWSGLEGGGPKTIQCNQFEYADYAVLSPKADDLYYTARVMFDTVRILGKNDPDKILLLNTLEETFNLIDWTCSGDENFYASVAKAQDYLAKAVEQMPKSSPVTVTAIGHTHIDVAWLWRLKHTREKAARSFSTVFRLMERYPEYVFLQTQPQLYAYIKKDYPEIYEKIKERVKEGRWEVDGAMWLEADCNITSGESLVRQILHGSRFMKEEFNQDTKYLWLPDVFGYSWALPQILRKSGIDTFMTTKISWNQYNRLPHDTFNWRGIDGSEVLTHFISTPDPVEDGNTTSFYTYNGLLEPSTVRGIYDNYQDKEFNSDLLLSYGHGDGGGGVNRDMLEKRRRLDKMPGLPNVKTGKAGEFFDNLHKSAEQTDKYVHTWDGELYLEYHRGTYTSQASIKKWNRTLELAYRDAEILHTWAGQFVGVEDYPAKEIKTGWETILRNHFHDIIPGSSIQEVYEDCEVEYSEANENFKGIMDAFATKFITQKDNQWTLINSAGWTRSEVVNIPFENKALAGHFVDENQQVLKSEKNDQGYQVAVDDITALSSKTIMFVETKKETAKAVFEVDKNKITTPFYEIEWNDDGQLTSIYDKSSKRQVIEAGGMGNYLQLFEDKPIQYDAWDIELYYVLKKKVINASKIEVVTNNSLMATVRFTYEFGKSVIVQDMNVFSDSRRIDFATNVDWKERQQLLKASFDVDIRATEARYDIQFGNVKRPTHWNTSWDMAKFETVAHQWVDFAERDYGVALLNNCKYGHSVKDKTMSISLLKGAIYPDPTADIKEHTFTYSILPHEGDFVEGNVVEEAWSLNSPILALPGDMLKPNLMEVDSEEPVVIDAIKKWEDGQGMIVRLHDQTGSKRSITLTPQFEYTSWQETNLMEKPCGESVKNSDGKIQLELTPYEVKTFLIK